MSYILIDAGNSCLKICALAHLSEDEISYDILDYNDLYEQLYSYLSDCILSQVLVCNVNNQVVFNTISDAVYALWNIDVKLVSTEQNKYGITTRYNNPRTLGTDRWLAMIAAKNEFDSNLCVIDCGTAVTIDVLTKEGMHVGGLITPGLRTARNSLGLHTNNLPTIVNSDKKINNQSSLLAINTEDAILGGTLYQLSAYIELIVSEIKQEFGDNTNCIITGGDAMQIHALSNHHFYYRDGLVLEGLKFVARDLFDKAYT